jgi:hypothetical protein
MASLWENGDRLKRLKAKFLPYYNEELRRARLADVRNFCSNNLDHVPLYVDRRLHFQAFDRLYKAFQEFLQLLFISHRIYPIAYDKWIKEQIEEILGMPELYKQLPSIFEIRNFQSREITVKAEKLGCLVNEYTQ